MPPRILTGAVFLLGLSLLPASAQTVIFRDTFERPNNRNIDAELGGITNNTGSALGVDGVYTHSFIDPANIPGPQDGNATNGGGAQISTGQLQLAVGAGTSNAYINHNFTNGSILAAGGFTVTLDITGYNQSTAGQGGAFAIGMTQAEANSGGDAISGATKFQDGFVDGTFNTDTALAISDFWIALRGDGSLIWGGFGNSVGGTGVPFGTATGLLKTGTVSVSFTGFANFNAGTSVNYAVSYNGAPVAAATGTSTGSFAWSDTNANYIGVDARDNTAVVMDNLTVSTIPEPSAFLGLLSGASLLLWRRRAAR